MEKVDFQKHEEYNLGDTHLTYDQVARAAGVTSDRVRRDERLADVPRVQIAGRRGAPLALEYTGAVHAYIQQPPSVRSYTYRYPDRRAALTKELKRLWKRMPLKKAAEQIGVSHRVARTWMLKHGIRAPVDWSRRLKQETAYARQCKALEMRKAYASYADIKAAMGISDETVRTYLRETYDKPEPIKGRTPIWERPPEEHGLW